MFSKWNTSLTILPSIGKWQQGCHFYKPNASHISELWSALRNYSIINFAHLQFRFLYLDSSGRYANVQIIIGYAIICAQSSNVQVYETATWRYKLLLVVATSTRLQHLNYFKRSIAHKVWQCIINCEEVLQDLVILNLS